MTAYWIMYGVPALLAFAPHWSSRGRYNPLWVSTAILLIAVIGLRYEVGGDWLPYWVGFNNAVGKPLIDSVVLQRDPGYWFINWLFANTGYEIWSLNLFCAGLSVTGIMAVASKQPHPWVALAIAVPYILVVVSMGYVRQAAALGLICWAFVAIQDGRQLRFLMFAIAATTFHKSAVVILPLFLLTLPRIQMRHWLMLGIVLGFVVSILVLETFESQWYNYVERQKESSGALIRVVMNMPAAILLLVWSKKLGFDQPGERHWYWLAVASVIAVLLVNYASTAVDRLALYLLPLQMVVLSRGFRLFSVSVMRTTFIVGVLLAYGVTLYVWLNYAKHADSWLPYQFYPVVGL